MHRVLVSLAIVFMMIPGHPLGMLAQPARPETAADLLPADMFATGLV